MLRSLFLGLTLCWGMFAWGQPSTEVPLAIKKEVLLVMGDSLSASYGIPSERGWVQLLTQRLQTRKYAVVNASISGETTRGGYTRLPQLLVEHHPTLVILELGANDGLRGLSLRQMQDNLAKMIERVQQSNAKILLLGMRVPPNYGKLYADRFHQVFHDLAATYQVALVPFFLEHVADKPDLMQEDNLHPTAEAQEKILENVWEKMETLLTQ